MSYVLFELFYVNVPSFVTAEYKNRATRHPHTDTCRHRDTVSRAARVWSVI